jgi:hypothetical protein
MKWVEASAAMARCGRTAPLPGWDNSQTFAHLEFDGGRLNVSVGSFEGDDLADALQVLADAIRVDR